METSHEIRIDLAHRGWNTEDRLSDFGRGDEYGYSAWVSRWDWHGVNLGNKVCFGSSVKPADISPENIDAAWRMCHEMAIDAWSRFPDSLPRQDNRRGLVTDVTMTNILINAHGGNPWSDKSEGRR